MSPSVSVRLLLTQSDARLVELAHEGHERAFEALVQRYRRPLLGYCRRLLLRDERAEDALQQGLLQAWLALQDGCVVREVKPWLYRIVHNCALNALRVSGYDYNTLSETLRGADAPEQDLDRRIAVREALAGLAALPQMQREALMRTALDGHSHEQVARALGLSEGALRGLLYRARVTLRAATTALTPSPAISWALSPRAGASAPLVARLTEVGTGGGSVGLGGMLAKGSTIAITAGALAGGIAVVHHPAGHPHLSVPPKDGSSPHVLLAATGASGAPVVTSQQVGSGRGAPSSDGRSHGSASRSAHSRSAHSSGRASEKWRIGRPDSPGLNSNTHGDGQPSSRNAGAVTHDGQGPSNSSGGSDHGGRSAKEGSIDGSGTSKDTSKGSDGSGDTTTATPQASSPGKDSISSDSGAGSGDSQMQTSSGTTSTSTSGDSGSSSSGGTTDSTSSGSKDGEPSSSASGTLGEKAPSISWEPLHSGANS